LRSAMESSSFCIVALCLFHIGFSNSCEWTVLDNNQEPRTLDLSCLSGKVLEASQSDDNGNIVTDYSFSICDNSLSCDNGNVMAAQYPKDLAPRCFNVGIYDPSVNPKYSDISGGQWSFTYIGDPTDCPQPGREWIPSFICDSTTEYQIGAVTEIQKCNYAVSIRTKFACVDKHYECNDDQSSSTLSGGWIFIIIFLSVFVLYCIVGYIVMAKTVNKERGFGDFSNNIPNKTLWIKCIFLVIAGCSVTKEYLIQKLIKKNQDDYDISHDGESGEDESTSSNAYQLDLDTN